jgi:hypothetical protein
MMKNRSLCKPALMLLLSIAMTPVVMHAEMTATIPSNTSGVQVEAGVPSLETLAADWMVVATLRNFPSVNNFWGALKTGSNLTEFSMLTFPPFANGGTSGVLSVDGKPVKAVESRWYPYQVLRRTTQNGIEMESAIRMPFEQRGVLCQLTLKNTGTEKRTLDLSMQFIGAVRKHYDRNWNTWSSPHGEGGNTVALAGADSHVLTAVDTEGAAATANVQLSAIAFAFSKAPADLKMKTDGGVADWKVTLDPGETTSLGYTVAIDTNAPAATTLASAWAGSFNAVFAESKTKWEARWNAAFAPGNDQFSGHLPTLVTDDEKLRRVYYESALASLELMRTSFRTAKVTFPTAGPQWALTLSYFWDTEMSAGAWSMLDPQSLRENLSHWLTVNLHAQVYGFDNLSLTAGEKWYAANDWSVFRTVDAYLSTTGDREFLTETIQGKTVLEHLIAIATAYREFTHGQTLADYGENTNLLECAPNYAHRVPSFNAANVYMLRRAADYLSQSDDSSRADALRSEADKLRDAVLSLYLPGDGVWMVEHNDGKKFPTRHCLDYIVVGQAMGNDLTPQMKSEMTAFVQKELISGSWFRAMSLKDIAAAKSDRPDHGPKGSYDGWPPLTIEVMCRFGAFKSALEFLHSTEAVTHESTFSQSHEFIPDTASAGKEMVRIAYRGGQDFNEVCGAAFMQTIISAFFGFNPEVSGDHFELLAPTSFRGFIGQLKHVSWHGKQYTIVSDDKGVHAVAE